MNVLKLGWWCLLLLFSTTVVGQVQNRYVEGKIEVEPIGERLKISGIAINKTELKQSIRYRLSIIRSSDTGSNAKTDQEGSKVLEGFQQEVLAITAVNSGVKDRVIILLLIFDTNDQIIGTSRHVINDNKEEAVIKEELLGALQSEITPQKQEEQPEVETYRGFILQGMVIDETKTKAGTDFYKLFYSAYLTKQIKGNYTIVIKEVIAMGNTTKVSVNVNDQTVFEFFVRTQYDFIRTMSEAAIVRVMAFIQVSERNQNVKPRMLY